MAEFTFSPASSPCDVIPIRPDGALKYRGITGGGSGDSRSTIFGGVARRGHGGGAEGGLPGGAGPGAPDAPARSVAAAVRLGAGGDGRGPGRAPPVGGALGGLVSRGGPGRGAGAPDGRHGPGALPLEGGRGRGGRGSGDRALPDGGGDRRVDPRAVRGGLHPGWGL